MYNDIQFNVNLISGMNAIMVSMNDERAYMEWINTVPDDCTDDDIIFICEQPDLFKETITEFMRIFKKYSKYGLSIETKVGDEHIKDLFK